MIIALEGINGAGKTTQAKLLADRIESEFPAVKVRSFVDPGVTPGHRAYTELRPMARFGQWDNPMTRLMIYMAARCELISAIDKSLAANELVLLDRWAASFYAYSAMTLLHGNGNKAEEENVFKHAANVLLACNAQTPDLSLFMDVRPYDAVGRMGVAAGTKDDVYETCNDLGQKVASMGQLSDSFLRLFHENPTRPCIGHRCVIVDCLGVSRETANAELWRSVAPLVETKF